MRGTPFFYKDPYNDGRWQGLPSDWRGWAVTIFASAVLIAVISGWGFVLWTAMTRSIAPT